MSQQFFFFVIDLGQLLIQLDLQVALEFDKEQFDLIFGEQFLYLFFIHFLNLIYLIRFN